MKNNEKSKRFSIKNLIKKEFDIKLSEQIEIRNIINDFQKKNSIERQI